MLGGDLHYSTVSSVYSKINGNKVFSHIVSSAISNSPPPWFSNCITGLCSCCCCNSLGNYYFQQEQTFYERNFTYLQLSVSDKSVATIKYDVITANKSVA